MPPWVVQLFSEVRSLREALDAHVTTFREEQGRWDSERSMTAQLTTTINFVRDGAPSPDADIGDFFDI